LILSIPAYLPTFSSIPIMFLASSLFFILVLLAQSSFGAVYITSPIQVTQLVGAGPITVSWQDDGNSPTLSAVGKAAIAIYTGSITQQTFLQMLATDVPIPTTASIVANIDPNIGPSGQYYFIRIISNSLSANSTPPSNYQAFSARFSLTQMGGTFNATVNAQNDIVAGVGSSSSASTTAAKANSAASNSTIAHATAVGIHASASAADDRISAAHSVHAQLAMISSALLLGVSLFSILC